MEDFGDNRYDKLINNINPKRDFDRCYKFFNRNSKYTKTNH